MVVTTAPYNLTLAIVPDDTTNMAQFTTRQLLTDAVYVGVTGDVVAVTDNGDATTWKAVPAGTFLPIAVKRVNGSGTTATNLIACYWS